ncbi:putative E3 ubiquitin-protein ligase LUL2 [Diplonema papillatum]|nr:putative E3 ubiquitin-protein ligase LUL2 [Diplonema papillatum]
MGACVNKDAPVTRGATPLPPAAGHDEPRAAAQEGPYPAGRYPGQQTIRPPPDDPYHQRHAQHTHEHFPPQQHQQYQPQQQQHFQAPFPPSFPPPVLQQHTPVRRPRSPNAAPQFQHVPNGPHQSFYSRFPAVQRLITQTPLVPEVTEVRTLRNLANLRKGTVSLTRAAASPHAHHLSFKADTSVPCTASVFAYCEEIGCAKGDIHFKSLFNGMKLQPVPPVRLPEGTNVECTSDAIDFSEFPTASFSPTAQSWALVIQLEYMVPSTSESGASPTRAPAHAQSQFSYLQIDTENETANVQVQKLQVGREVFEVEDIYGAHVVEETPLEDTVADKDDLTCVICLTEPRDTLVMPCRHQCLCFGCASYLRKQMNKCPMCRGQIEGLLKGAQPLSPAEEPATPPTRDEGGGAPG